MSGRAARARPLAWALILLGTFPIAFLSRPWLLTSAITLCPFRAVTGRPCVFCGLTRAFACATHGEFAQAFGFHPFWWVAALLIGGMGVAFLVTGLTGRELPRLLPLSWRARSWLVVGFIVVGSLVRAFVTDEASL